MASVTKIRLSIAATGVAAACVISGFNTALAAADVSFTTSPPNFQPTSAAPKVHGSEANARHKTARTNRVTSQGTGSKASWVRVY